MDMRIIDKMVLLLVIISTHLHAADLAADAAKPTSPVQYDARLQWWREARFGMFIHYGPVTLTGKEISWSRANSNPKCPNNGETPVEVYDNLYKQFNAVQFNAAEWVDVAKAAGMKYVVLTAKHCDGFLLWNSKVDGYNVAATPFKRDICAELAEAVHQKGLWLGWYYSPMDWRDPDCRTERNSVFIGKMQGELRELLTNYGKIDLLWFDHDGREAVFDSANTYRLVKELQPQIIINNRLDLGVNQRNTSILNPNADYYTPEQRIGGYDDQRPWETCMTICRQWSWKPDDELKSLKQCLHALILCAAGDGNLLLNVGPMPDGRIEPRQIERLKEMGAWLAKNGQTIYGTRGGPWQPTSNIASTRKDNIVYLHLLREDDGMVELPALSRQVKHVSFLEGSNIEFKQADGKLHLTFGKARIDPVDTIIRLELDGSAMDMPSIQLVSEIKAAASNVYQNENDNYGPQMAFDNDVSTRWATDPNTKQVWIAAEFSKLLVVESVRIEEALGERVKKFEFQYRDGKEWKTIFSGEKIGYWFQKKLDTPIKAREFRLNILDATDGPTINEIELY